MLASSTASCLVEAVESSESESVTAQVQLLQLYQVLIYNIQYSC